MTPPNIAPHSVQRPSVRTRAAVLAGKLTRRASRRIGRGGTALPGLVAERIDADLVARLAAQLDAAVLVTGTNGKTTTSRMLAGILERNGRIVVHNRAGSNLMRGIGAALIEAAGADGVLPAGAVGVFETDEATLAEAARAVRPRALLIGNLSRDQLDRYGEIEAVRGQWLETVAALPAQPTDSPSAQTTLVLNADDPSVSTLARAARGPVLQFGVDDAAVAQPSDAQLPDEVLHSRDALWDEETGAEFQYDRRYFSHLGHWRCAGADLQRPEPDLVASAVDLSAPDGLAFTATGPGGPTGPDGTTGDEARVRSPLRGLYNVYNALAAIAAAGVLGVPLAEAAEALAGTAAAFGRQEELQVYGHRVRILLGKNPAGVNVALQTLIDADADATPPGHHLLVLLNDGLADGTDISWIWDTDWELLRDHVDSLVVGGRRAADMALRLCYAGLPSPLAVQGEIDAALSARLDSLPKGAPLVVLPTYTALLDVREQLGRLAGAQRIWEGA